MNTINEEHSELSAYEAAQLGAIQEWKAKEPSVAGKVFGHISERLAWLVQKVVPQRALERAIRAANWAADKAVDSGDILRDGGVAGIEELRRKGLELSDTLADSVHDWAIGIATVEGGATGAAGLPGLAVDLPALVTLALRTIHKIGLCYGYETSSEAETNFALGILSAAGANSVKEKIDALLMLKAIQTMLLKTAWSKMAENALSQQLSKEGAIIALRKLAAQLGINLSKRKLLQVIPVMGGLVGAGMNASYLNDVAWAARRVYQERWLLENGKVV